MDIRLRILCEQQYIGRRYNSSYKLKGKPATYHVLSRGIKILRDKPAAFNVKALRNLARDKDTTVTDTFISHNLGIFEVYTKYKNRYRDDLLFITKSNLHGRDTFPQPFPDAYVSLKSDKTKHCFLESFTDTTQFFIIKKRIKYFADFAEDNDLPKTRVFPGIVFICSPDKLKEQVLAFTAKRFGNSWKEIYFAVFTRAELDAVENLFSFRK